MSENTILTQREIDSLLSGESPPPEPTPMLSGSTTRGLSKTVKRYDFRRPDKFSKEHLRTLQALHETFARLVASSLSNRLRCNAEIKVSSIDQGLYEEYLAQIPTPTFSQVIHMAPLEGSLVMEYSHDLGLAMVDRLLGGSGALLDRAHEVTDIELQLLRGLGGAFCSNLAEAWENLAEVRPTVTEIFQDAQLAQIAPPTEVVIMVFMEVSLLNVVAGLSLCTPFSVLESVMPRLNTQMWVGTGSRRTPTPTSRLNLRRQVERTPAPISVELGSATVRARDLSGLQPGDVIRLDGSVRRPVPVRVNGIRKWFAVPAIREGRICVRIDRLDPEETVPPRSRNGNERESAPAALPPASLPATTRESEEARAA